MSFNKEISGKFAGYLAEIKSKCRSCKNDISQEEYDQFLFYFKEASEFLTDKDNTSQLAMQNNDQQALIAICDEIILIFTKYFIAKRDEGRNDRLKNTSIIKEGMLAFKGNAKNAKEVQHVLSLLKVVYFDRFENAIKILNKFDDQQNTLEKIRVRFYQARNPAECTAILWQLNQRYKSIIANEIPELKSLIASYSNILDKQLKANSAMTSSKPTDLAKAAFFSEKREKVVKQADTTPHSAASCIKNLIERFNH